MIAILVIYIIQGEKNISNRNHALRMSPDVVESGNTPPDPLPINNADFKSVNVGIYLDGIETFSIKDFY
ncbi:hypothetical protein [Polynucleobacter necessarius]|uniref:hypothetical protein n=1 Tax=Polynucleobacter necessarius TaxID=576610 RepID=UPI0013B04F4F|nr:hypothetical protein [Polynucleobacter necessarius]